MPRRISQSDLRRGCGAILDALEHGEEFVVTRHSVPVGELRPIRRTFVQREVLMRAVTTALPLSPRGLRKDVDAVVDQRTTPYA
jgi:antitoxin (DNA-binding transcriptional repressor) of toxin-antitoxin stability system